MIWRRPLRSSIVYLLISVAFAVSVQAREMKDATGTEVHFSDHPVRIVTLAPSVAELTAEFLGPDLQRIVGVSENTDYPPALEKRTSIGPYQQFNLEQVAALKPDLVIATVQGNSKDQVLHLRELGLPVFVLDTGNFDQIESAMVQMPEILGEGLKGAVVAETFKKRLAEIQKRGAEHAKSPRRVLIQLDDSPLIVAGGGSFLNDELKAVGAENVYADTRSSYPRPSLEDVLKKNPDFVLVMAFGPDLKPFKKMAARWRQYPGLLAAKKNQVKVIYADSLLRPSMRLLEGLGVLEKTLYGKL